MKSIYFLFFAIVSVTTFAQSPIINQNALPSPGDTFSFGVDKLPIVTFDYKQQGATWDLSSLQNDTVQFASYGVSSTLDFISEFPESNLYTYGPGFLYGGLGGSSPYGGNFGHMLFASNNNGFKVVGFRSDFGFGLVSVTTQPNEMLMPVPFTYGDSVFQQSFWQMEYNNIPMDIDTFYKRTTYKSLTAKGYGTLQTPYASFANCLAVEEKIIFHDSLFLKIGNVIILDSLIQSDTLLNVNVWCNERHNSILIATYHPVTKVCEKISWLNYQDLAGIQKTEESKKIATYPNPTQVGTTCHLEANQANKIEIFSMDGRLVAIIPVMDQQFYIPNALNSGSYLIKIWDDQNFIGNNTLLIN